MAAPTHRQMPPMHGDIHARREYGINEPRGIAHKKPPTAMVLVAIGNYNLQPHTTGEFVGRPPLFVEMYNFP